MQQHNTVQESDEKNDWFSNDFPVEAHIPAQKNKGQRMYPLPLFVVHILSKAQVTLKKMEHMKNTVDMAQFFMLSQMVVRSFYFVVLEAIAFRPNKPHHKNGFEIGNFFVFHDD